MVDQKMVQEIKDRLEILRQRLPIDQFQLEIACINQPVLYDEVGGLMVEWRFLEQQARDKLLFVHADHSSRIRVSPEKYGVAKITEGSVESAITLTKEHQEAKNDLIEIEKIVGYLKVLQTALDHRKSELNNLVQLWVKNYYSKLQDMDVEKGVMGKITEQQIVQERIKNAAKRDEMKEQ